MLSQSCSKYPKNKFAISLRYLKKEVSDEVDILHADKHESLIQIDTMVLMGMAKHSQSSQNSKFAMSLQYLKKEVRDEVDFLHADKHQSFLLVDFNTLGIKISCNVMLSFLIGMIKHSQSTQSIKFAQGCYRAKLLMFLVLQYLKKEDRNGFHFLHADKHQSFYKLGLSFLMEVVRHVQSTQNMKLVIFLEYIIKSVTTVFVFYCDAKHSDVLRGSTHVHCHFLKINSGIFILLKHQYQCCI